MELHFLRPYWFLAIVPVLFFCWRLTKISLADNWRLICDPHLLDHLLVTSEKSISNEIILLLLSCLIAIVSLAGPSWNKEVQPIYRAGLGTVLVLNLSPSMADSIGSTKKIERARFKMLDFLARLTEGQTGLVVYTDEAYTISPLTEDSRTIANFVPILDPTIMPTFEDDTAVGLKEGEKLLRQAGLNRGNIILITDKITHFSKARQIAASLLLQGYHLYVLDISSQQGFDNQKQELARAGGGRVISLTPGNQDIEMLLAKTRANALLPAINKSKEKGLIWQDNGRILIFLLLPLALLAFRRGYV